MWTTLRDSVRAWRRSPGVALVAVLSLGLGIGATTAAFSVVEQLLLRTLAVPNPHQLFRVTSGGNQGLTYPVWQQIRDRPHLFDRAYAWFPASLNIAPAGPTDIVAAAFATASVFETLDITAARGRLFDARNDVRGGGPEGHVAVVSHAFWRGRLGGDPDVIGRSITIERVRFTIIGVLPATLPGLVVGEGLDLLLPLAADEAIYGPAAITASRTNPTVRVMLRLGPTHPPAGITAQLRDDQATIRAATLPRGPARTIELFLREPFALVAAANGGGRASYFAASALIALGLGAAVLLAACGNVATVLLAHGARRQRELSVRAALGASPWHGVGQRFADSAVIATAGVAVGLLLAFAGGSWLTAQLSALSLGLIGTSQMAAVGLDWRVAATGVAAGGLTTLLCGLAPALAALRVRATDILKANGSSRTASERSQRALIAAQLALSVGIVLVGTLLFRSYRAQATMVETLRPDGAFIADLRFWRSDVADATREQSLDAIIHALSGLPGVAVAAANYVPMAGGAYHWPTEVPGVAVAPIVVFNSVTHGYFAAVNATLLSGRWLEPRDVAGQPMVGVANRAFARAYLSGESHVPQTIWRVTPARGDEPEHRQEIQIVGVVQDQVSTSFLETPEPQVFIARAQDTPENFNTFLIARAPPGTAASTISMAITAAAPGLSFTMKPYGDYLWRDFARERFLTQLAGFFVALATLLAGIGVFAVLSYSVAARQRELGVRIAVGATARQVSGDVFKRAAVLVAIGSALGLVAGSAASRLMATRLHGVADVNDSQSLATVAVAMAMVAGVAAWLPARRAAAVDPIVVLRDD